MLVLQLAKVPSGAVRGIYGANHVMPERALYVHPSAYAALISIAPRVVCSDIFRSPESSLEAMQRKVGVQPPGYSHHNYGGAVDLAVRESMERGGFRTKVALDAFMLSAGFPPFNVRLGATGAESWHFSHIPGWVGPGGRNTAPSAEAWIQIQYGAAFVAFRDDIRAIQAALAKLGHYHGRIDGDWGPQSRTSLGMFQRALKVASYARVKGVADFSEGVADKVTCRVLAYCTADREIVEGGLEECR